MAESNHKSRQFYQKVNGMGKGYKGHTKCIRNKDGKLITKKIEIAEKC